MVTFPAFCPEPALNGFTLYLFKVGCLCLGHICPVLPSVRLSYPMRGIETVDSTSVTEPSPIYLMCGKLANKFSTDPESIVRCVELVDNFEDQALLAGYDPRESVIIHERNDIVQELPLSYKVVCVPSDVDTNSTGTILQSPGKLAMQPRTQAQAPEIDLAKTSQVGTASSLVSKLRSPKRRSGDDE